MFKYLYQNNQIYNRLYMAYNEIDTNDMEIWKKSCLKTIYRWEELYDDYKYYETILIENINNIIDIKEEIKNTPKFIDKDDNDFNLALIENSLYFLIKSLKVNRIKFLEDYNKLWLKLDSSKQYTDIDKYIFSLVLKQYKIISDKIFEKKQFYNYQLTKSLAEDIQNLLNLETSINKILIYHKTIIKYLSIVSEIDKSQFMQL